jgi:hypothetical protein
MRTALVIAVLLAASPAHGASLTCALWPNSCQPAVVIPAQPAPAMPPEPLVVTPVPAPSPPAAVRIPAPPRHVQTGLPPRPKWKPAPKRKVAALPDWCARVPKGTTMGQIEFAAGVRGQTLTEKNRQQARACLASK